MAATSAGTQNANEHRCGMVGRWDTGCSVGWLRLWRGLTVRVLGVLRAWPPCTCVKVYIDWCSVFFSKI